MAYAYSEFLAKAQQWANAAAAAGFLTADQIAPLLEIDQRSPEGLFIPQADASKNRPLIVAFMGGTGVGKSSLLNRLAGEPIARVGVERPTSREVTLYHHQSLTVHQLPTELPLNSIKLNRHKDDKNRNVVWIDMPDFDSVELSNKKLVLEWLPHIDALLYVVSPERYRDNKAWQLLLAEGKKHAWLFVMNQWDRGQAIQFDDFKQQLSKAGFANPLLFRTSCIEQSSDEFSELVSQLQQLETQQGVEQLQQRSLVMRRQQLVQMVQNLSAEFNSQDYAALQAALPVEWQKQSSALISGLAWPLQQLAQSWAQNLGQGSNIKLWDEWAQNRLEDFLDELVLHATQHKIPSLPIKSAIQGFRTSAGKTITHEAEATGRLALLKPGGQVQRFFIRLIAIAETLLPITAMSVVAYQVFFGFFHSAAAETAYLGVDFAVHSLLLIGLSWLIPFFLHKKIQPSLQKAALKGLSKGLKQGLISLQIEIAAILQQQQQQHANLQQELEALLQNGCDEQLAGQPDKHTLIGRALLDY